MKNNRWWRHIKTGILTGSCIALLVSLSWVILIEFDSYIIDTLSMKEHLSIFALDPLLGCISWILSLMVFLPVNVLGGVILRLLIHKKNTRNLGTIGMIIGFGISLLCFSIFKVIFFISMSRAKPLITILMPTLYEVVTCFIEIGLFGLVGTNFAKEEIIKGSSLN